MVEADDPRLAVVVGGNSVGANLDRAIKAGAVVRHDDGRFSRPAGQDNTDLIGRHGGALAKLGEYRPPCRFLNFFLFEHAYAKQAVPFGCRECFKIKLGPKSLRQLMVVKEIAEATGHTTKSGSEADNPTNAYPYATYLYFRGLDEARRAYKVIRERVDDHARLGPSIVMTIKRGCSNYERNCGPSDQYTFDPALEEVETYLQTRFETRASASVSAKALDEMRMLRLIATAYRIGDDTYTDFTGGKPLVPPLVSYSPEGDAPGPS